LTPQSAFAGDLSAFNASNNRLIASGYDFAGNQTVDAQNRTFTYDAENRQITFNGTAGQYFYDGDGRRVKKIDGTGTTVFVYNAGGQLIAEYHSDPVPPASGGGGTSYLTSDHLGSTRVVTKADGTVKARYDYLPFGEELGSGIGSRTVGMGYSAADSTRQKFTQKERDNESGLDYFGARYYGSAQGRFTGVDPYNPIVDIDKEENFRQYLGQPQNWNRYTFVWNNPLKFIDPNGENVYVVTYTYGNSEGDEELKRSAETRANEIQKSKGFDAKKDTVLLRGVYKKEDFAGVLKDANALEKQFGKVEQVVLYSHAGPEQGPVFHIKTAKRPNSRIKSCRA
jgi:RHS repeat-associated protein